MYVGDCPPDGELEAAVDTPMEVTGVSSEDDEEEESLPDRWFDLSSVK